ncbi:MAG: bifunctional 5,10-methylenetetrahydrofolate dehydrogenase/5,10-methenyltetrahydrofolate cyclohydrolase, partial [Patescibacteria group bacterium]
TAEEIKKDLKEKIAKMKTPPSLAAVLAGDDPSSELYVKLKEASSRKIGMEFHKYLCNEKCYPDISQKKLLEVIDFLNKDKTVNGIIVQLPLPEKYDPEKVINKIDPKKDVDGFHPKNNLVVPPTISAILELLKQTKQDLKGKSALIIAKGDVFTKGIEKRLNELWIKTKNSREIPADSKDYDIIIIALGKAKSLKKSMVKKDSIIIDVGINRTKNGIVGDADPKVAEVCGFLSPVPGGVGPLTVACLLKNTVLLAQEQIHEE